MCETCKYFNTEDCVFSRCFDGEYHYDYEPEANEEDTSKVEE